MKNLLFWSAALLCAALAACTKADVEEPTAPQPGMKTVRLYLSDETTESAAMSACPSSRAYYADGYKIAWEAGDQVAINPGDTYDVQQDVSGNWFVELPEADSYTVYYPAASFTGKQNSYDVFKLNSDQTYRDGSFDKTAFAARAVAKSGGKLTFKYMCSLVKLTLRGTEAERVASIRLDAIGGEALSLGGEIAEDAEGNAYLRKFSDPAYVNLFRSYVNLTADNIPLTAEGVDFYITIMPATFSEGFRITVTLADGRTMVKTGGTGQSAGRGKILAMPAFAVETAPVYYSTDNSNWKPWRYGTDGGTPSTLDYPATEDHMLYFKDNDLAPVKGLTAAHLQSLSATFIANNYLSNETATPTAQNPIGLDLSRTTCESTTFPTDFLYDESKYNISLTYLSLPGNITSVAQNAFSKSQVLATVVLPASLAELQTNAFWVARGIKNVYCYATEPPKLGSNVFSYVGWGDKGITFIHVPAENWTAYNNSWGTNTWISSRTTLVGDL